MGRFTMFSGRLASLSRFHASRSLLALVAVAATALPSTADAARRAGGTYDGNWTAVFTTTRGVCSSGHSFPFLVVGGRLVPNGGGHVSGSVNRGGGVSVAVRVGASHATGAGRVAGNSGSGRWSGLITGDHCSGTWQATRS